MDGGGFAGQWGRGCVMGTWTGFFIGLWGGERVE